MQRHTLLLIPSTDAGWSDLRRVLCGLSEIAMLGEATTFRQARDLAAEGQPDAIIAATRVAGRSTVPLLALLHQRYCPRSKIILVGHRYLSARERTPAETGVVGYVLWHDLADDAARHYLASALAGDVFLASRDVVRPFIHARRYPTDPPAPPPLDDRQRAVLRSLASGASHKQVAAQTGLSLKKVERLITELKEDLDAPTLFVLGQRASRLGLLDEGAATQTRHESDDNPSLS